MKTEKLQFDFEQIIEEAEKTGELNKLEEELYFFTKLINKDYKLKTDLESIEVDNAFKKEIVRQVMPEATSSYFFEILEGLIEKKKFKELYLLSSAVSQLVAEKEGVFFAELITAIPVNKIFIKEVQKKLSNLTGKKIKLKHSVDENLIGGMVIKFKGGEIIDASIRWKLEELGNYLRHGD